MNEYIKREDAMKPLYEKWKAAESRGDDDIAEIVKMDYITVSNVPSADVEPVRHGYWKCKEVPCIYGKKFILTCSECGGSVSVTELALTEEHYCRSCGARMDRKEQEQESEDKG